jgi:hypothetical protein
MSEPNRTSFFKWLAIGCGVALLCLAACVVVLLTIVFGSMRSSTPYKEAVQRASRDPRVITAIGSPIQAGWLVSGNIDTQAGGTGNADLTLTISGSKGKASLHVLATKSGGRWVYSEMKATPEKGEPIDLLLSSERSTSTAPRAE